MTTPNQIRCKKCSACNTKNWTCTECDDAPVDNIPDECCPMEGDW